MRKIIAVPLVAILLLVGCAKQPVSSQSASALPPLPTGGSTTRTGVNSTELQFATATADMITAVIKTEVGDIVLVLYPEHAPLAVENFCKLAMAGYYSGTAFHRVLPSLAIQGGDAGGTGISGHSIWGSTLKTESTTFLHHYSGALCLAAADGQRDTHLSQFYIVATPQDNLGEAALQKLTDAGYRPEVVDAYRQAGGAPWLDNTDTVFGQVIDGMDVVDTIAEAELNEDGSPRRAVQITAISIDNYVSE